MAPTFADGSRIGTRDPKRDTAMSLHPHEMEHIRTVYDEDTKDKRYSCIVSPRVDAQMFRNTERHAIPCESIVEIYELLWRWGHRNTNRPGFDQNHGFSIPDTIVIVRGRPYAWYFISKKDGSLLRKSDANLTLGFVEKKLCRDRQDGESPICATWLPMASQFQENRCHVPYAEFMTTAACRRFLSSMQSSHSGIIQAFVDPHGVSNFLVRTVQYKDQTSLCVRTNRSVLSTTGKGNPFDKCATFEGWPGLSSTSSRYRSHKHPQMEEMIRDAGERLNQRIEQERVRQMLFLNPTQHVALHFKVTKDHQLFFIYASVVSEKDVILQTRLQLLMGDPCMTEHLPGASLLPGGTDMKAIPYRGPVPGSVQADKGSVAAYDASCYDNNYQPMDEADRDYQRLQGEMAGEANTSRGRSGYSDTYASSRRAKSESKPKPEPDDSLSQFMPRVAYPRPDIPEPPFRIKGAPREEDHLGRPTSNLGDLKRPLIFPNSARSILSNQSPRGADSTVRSEPGSYSGLDASGRPPLLPDSWSSTG